MVFLCQPQYLLVAAFRALLSTKAFTHVAPTAEPSFEDGDLVLNRSGIGWPGEAMGSSGPCIARWALPAGRYQMKENYSLMATPLKPVTPMGLDVATGVRSP